MSDAVSRLTAALADRYRIERELGAGGMATVYLAHDIRHDRKVAIKVLRPELSAILGGERFLAEIKTTANLQHPHILSLFDSGEADGLVYYVMPFVEGESLRDRLNREKQLPVEEAVRIAREVADALAYAHQHGIVHRDIKPENILLHGGHALVADFGIALAAARSDGGTRMTETGMSLGTPHYMAPEQAMGEREITPKADLYALGCVLYEMLTAEPPFTGATAQAIIARVMTEEPRSLTLQRRTIPPHVEDAVQTALAKLPADRFASAAEFGAALAGGGTGTTRRATAARATQGRPSPRALRGRALAAAPWALSLVLAGVVAALAFRRPPAVPLVGRFSIRLAPRPSLSITGQALAFSPDGSRIAFVGNAGGGDQLFVRSLDRLDAVPLGGSVGVESPFFSPDGREVAFFAGGQLQKVTIGASLTLPICDVAGTFRGGSWGAGGTIVFADDRGLMRVSSAGGTPTLVAAPGDSESYRWPELLPGDGAVLFSIAVGGSDRLAAANVGDGRVRRYDIQAANPHWVDGGYVLYAVLESGGGLGDGSLVARRFNARTLAVAGEPIPVADSVLVGLTSRTAKLAGARDGALVFAQGILERGSLVSVSRTGQVRQLGLGPRGISTPVWSPDGRRIAVWVYDAFSDVWLFDAPSRRFTRLSTDRTVRGPLLWSPDGRRIVYSNFAGANLELATMPTDGSGGSARLLAGTGDALAGAYTPDGRTLIYRETGGRSGKRRIMYVNVDSLRQPHPFLADAFNDDSPALSPDGRWLAYVSDESGRPEVYVRPFPGPGGQSQVSNGGGIEPRWNGNGRELLFRSGPAMMAAPVTAGATFIPGEAHELFRGPFAFGTNFPDYSVSPDGGAFLMILLNSQVGEQPMTVVLNWFRNLSARSR